MLARRWQHLDDEAKELAKLIQDLVTQTARPLIEPFGTGVDTGPEISTVARDNTERIRSEAAFAMLAGFSPIPLPARA